MTITTKILSDNEEWELSANYDEKKKQYYCCHLYVPKGIDDESRVWDNPSYLFQELFPMIEKMHNRDATIPISGLNIDIYKYLQYDKENVDELYEVLSFGIKMGWDKIK